MSGFSRKVADNVIKNAQKGDLKALKELYVVYANAVLRLVNGILGSIEDSKDLTQDIFIKAYSKLPELKQPEAFTGWLKQLSVRMAIDQLRQRQHWVQDEILLPLEVEPDWLQLHTELLESDDITQWMAVLSEMERAVVWLFVMEGYRHDELGTMMNCSESAIRQRYRRAVLKLQSTANKVGK